MMTTPLCTLWLLYSQTVFVTEFTSASSWVGCCWCVHTSSCDSWWLSDGDGHNICWGKQVLSSKRPSIMDYTYVFAFHRIKHRYQLLFMGFGTKYTGLYWGIFHFPSIINILKETYFLQIILSQLYFEAKILKLGSMMPPLNLRTKWRVDSVQEKHNKSQLASQWKLICHTNSWIRYRHRVPGTDASVRMYSERASSYHHRSCTLFKLPNNPTHHNFKNWISYAWYYNIYEL
mgnify:CR=1 FL=1